jgi:hypothetical protein
LVEIRSILLRVIGGDMNPQTNSKSLPKPWLDVLQEQVGSLRYGIVQIVVHDRRVVQIERTEKFRFAPNSTDRAAD